MTEYRCIYLLLMLAGLPASHADAATAEQTNGKRYNVLFIAVDDMNDWAGPFGGNPQVKTPHMDRFAERAVVFTKAYCPATVCCPSRSALLTGKHATNTGVYGNGQNLKHAPKAKDLETLPEYFGNRGYHTLTRGKIFHKHGTTIADLVAITWTLLEGFSSGKPAASDLCPYFRSCTCTRSVTTSR